MTMKTGKISQTAWRRSVGKQFHMRRPGEVSQLTKESAGGALVSPDKEGMVWAEASAYGRAGRTGFYAVLEAAGNVAAKGADPAGISARILFPLGAEEETLRELTAGLEEACCEMDLQAACIQGEVSPAVRCPVITVTAAGRMPSDVRDGGGNFGKSRMYPGQEILLCGYAGLEGTLRILDEAEEELKNRFVPSFLATAKELKKDLVLPSAIETVYRLKGEAEEGEKKPLVSAVRQVGSGGILAALWDLAEMSGTGLEADMRSIRLRQETVEICEYFQLNPYQMTSAGCFLLAADHAEKVIEVLEGAGARAGRLGVARAQNARVITSGEEVRYLDRPAPDELAVWWEGHLSGERI